MTTQTVEDNSSMNTEPNLTVFQLARREDGIAVVTINVPGESQNTLKAEFVSEANALLDQLEPDASVRGVVLMILLRFHGHPINEGKALGGVQ